MSYARWSEASDVYVFRTNGLYCCAFCELVPPEKLSFWCTWPAEMIDHLYLHEFAGHVVPLYAIAALQAEASRH